MRYRKKPVEVEAYQITEFEYDSYMCCRTFINAPDWLMNSKNIRVVNGYLYVETLEGMMRVMIDKYIVCGVDGELYPCRANIFEKTYEVVNEDD